MSDVVLEPPAACLAAKDYRPVQIESRFYEGGEVTPVQSGGAAERDGEPLVISLRGDWDISDRDRLAGLLKDAATDTTAVLLDLSETNFVDSFAVWIIIKRMLRWTEESHLSALLASRNVYDVLRIMGVQDLVHAYRSRDDALAYLKAASHEGDAP